MGLDIYAGPVSRYAGGGWQTIVEQAGAAAGMPVITVRPGESMQDVLQRALAEGGGAAPIREIRLTDIQPSTTRTSRAGRATARSCCWPRTTSTLSWRRG